MEVVYRKTSALFEAGALIGAVLADQTRAVEEALALYGRNLGTAFQLIDDAMDYGGRGSDIGKNIGDDLAEGKPTLPLIHALRNGSPQQQLLIRKAIEEGGLEQLDEIVKAIHSTGALAYTAARARTAIDEAVAALDRVPDSEFKDALVEIAELSLQRQY